MFPGSLEIPGDSWNIPEIIEFFPRYHRPGHYQELFFPVQAGPGPDVSSQESWGCSTGLLGLKSWDVFQDVNPGFLSQELSSGNQKSW